MFDFNFWPFKRRKPAPQPAPSDKTFEVVYEGTGGAGGGGGASAGTFFIGYGSGGSGIARTTTTWVVDTRGEHHRRLVRNFHARAKDARARKPRPVRKPTP